MLTFENLLDGFRGLGVEDGDTLLVHSSYKSLGEVDGGPLTVIRALEAVLRLRSSQRTLLTPLSARVLCHMPQEVYQNSSSNPPSPPPSSSLILQFS